MSRRRDGYQSTDALVSAIKAAGDFEVSVSAYPEKHPQSPKLLHDVEALKRKVDAGADRAITQFFFDNDAYLRFLDVAAAAGITIPIVPGIVPVLNFKQTANFARKAGASVPNWLAERFEGLEDDPATRRLVAAAVCAEQVIDLIDRGVDHLHFYTMNRAGRPAASLEAAGEVTRLRLLGLLCEAELTVSELVAILGQSQPRVSRHLKLLVDAGLAERQREGAWAFFRLADPGGALARDLIARLDPDDPTLPPTARGWR